MINKERLVYIGDYEELFTDIQTQGILPDQKTFVDSEPKLPVKKILEEYREEKGIKNFSLKKFFDDHFELPRETVSKARHETKQTVEEYINGLWDVLTRDPGKNCGTLIPLPEKFVVPGGRFREIFYWDSYFTMLGLQVSGRMDLVENMINNFAALIDSFGFIPNGNRTYFLSRSQPPFFSFMIELMAEEKGDPVILKYLPQLEKEYMFWMDGSGLLSHHQQTKKRVVLMEGGEILNRYWDSLNTARPEGYMEDLETQRKSGNENDEIFRDLRAGAESGWDFSSRWLGDGMNLHTIRTTKIIPVDLNCLLLHLERTLEKGYRLLNNNDNAEKYLRRSKQREDAIQKYCWNEEDKIFGDYDFVNSKPTRAATIGMMNALVVKIATFKQVAEIVVQLESRFLQPGGLLSSLANTGQQWDAPNGWAPLQWMAFKGLMNYGEEGLAKRIAVNWTSNVESVFEKTGRITEKYNVVDIKLNAGGGEYPNQDGFGWTNGVYLKFKNYQ